MKRVKLIYLVSAKYSGSTLLSAVIGSNPDITTIGELRKFYSKRVRHEGEAILCSCGEPFMSCPYWKIGHDALMERFGTNEQVPFKFSFFRVFEHVIPASLSYKSIYESLRHVPARTFMPFKKKILELAEINVMLMRAFMEHDGTDVFFDTSKEILYPVFYSLLQDVDLYVINVVRDPRSQVNSALRRNDWSLNKAINYWKETVSYSRELLERNNIRTYDVTYERFCQEPQKVLDEITRFCHLDSPIKLEDFSFDDLHVMGNSGTRHNQTLEIKERIEWTERLSPEQIRRIESETRDFRRYYSKTVDVQS